jgi:RNA polymerase sigma-70 factor (ECF subfamily)
MQATTAPHSLPDREAMTLVKRFQAGDAAAFEGLYLGYFGSVYAYLRLALRDPHEAEDAAQQVFASVLDNLGHYEDRGKPFRAWLFTIARHQGLASRRAGQARADVTDPEVLDRTLECVQTIDAAAVGEFTDDALLRLVDNLPSVQRQVLMLRFAFEFQHDEIAEIVGRSPEAVRQLLSRAMKTLRTRFSPIRGSSRDQSVALTLQAA